MTDGICFAGLDVHARKTAAAAVQRRMKSAICHGDLTVRALRTFSRSLPRQVRRLARVPAAG